MTYKLRVLRRESGEKEGRWETYLYEPVSPLDTVATALTALNEKPLVNEAGRPAPPIAWDCGCLQQKCGACAMVIDGRPRLACSARLSESKTGTVSVEPLRKFPVVRDLIADRGVIFENLKAMRLWLTGEARLSERDLPAAYEASQCIRCGLCLEVCPNFYAGGSFFGMAAVPAAARLLTEQSVKDAREIARRYQKHVFAGCGKSLACKNVCPRGIDTEKLLVRSTAAAVWKRK